MCDVIYSDSRVISSSYISTTGGFAATSTVTRGTAFSFTDIAETAETLTISTGHNVPIFVDLADLMQSPWTKVPEIMKRIGQRIGERIEIEVLSQHASWRNLGGSGGNWTDNVATTLAVSAANVDDLIRLTRTVTRQQNGQVEMAERGIGIVWDAPNFEFVEA